MTKPIRFPDPQRHGIEMSKECKHFIQALLQKDPNKRLGSQNSVKEILDHPWLKCLNHQDFSSKKIDAPMKPTISANSLDLTNFDKSEKVQEVAETLVPRAVMRELKQ